MNINISYIGSFQFGNLFNYDFFKRTRTGVPDFKYYMEHNEKMGF